MKKDLLDYVICPNTGESGLQAYAIETARNNSIVRSLFDQDLRPEDEIVTGIIFHEKERRVYAVVKSVAVLLSDHEVQNKDQIELLLTLRKDCPPAIREMIDQTIAQLKAAPPTIQGRWAKDEMNYFDKDVESESMRAQFLEKIQRTPIWDLILSRKKAITDRISIADVQKPLVLEVGCGNSRTVSWIFSPVRRGYRYVGSDISLKRLFLAKKVIPPGDFVQCSVLNLPFREETFHAVLGFGVFHHLENPMAAIEHCARKVKRNGFLAMHEPIRRPKLLKKYSRLRPLFRGYVHSSHDNEIEGEKTLSHLQKNGFEILYKIYENSYYRYLAGRLLNKASVLDRRRWIHEFLISTDQMVIRTLGRLSPLFGPSSILFVAQKRSR